MRWFEICETYSRDNIALMRYMKDGKFDPNGYNKIYNANDELEQDGDFKDGRLFNGKMYVYDSDGLLLKVKVYKNGVYHSDGQLD